MNPFKKGFRALGIAESFVRSYPKSVLAGIVMRRDLIVDGVAFATATVGGLDATEAVLEIFKALSRRDINCIMLGGAIISWYNVIDLERVYRETGVPLLNITYEDSPGIEEFIRKHFEGDQRRLELYRKLGPREPLRLKTGAVVFVRYYGISRWEAEAALNAFTTHGGVPEPVRVANLVARAALRALLAGQADAQK